MPRRGRAASPSRPSMGASSRSSVPARSAPPPQQPMVPQQQMAQPRQPGLLGQMAATAGGVAIGSTVGHVVGHALVGGGNGASEAATQQQQQPAPAQYQQQGQQQDGQACAFELRQFVQCAQNQSDLSLCEGFNEALRQCKQQQSGAYY